MHTMPDFETSSDLYKIMLRIRLAELRVAEIYPSDKIQSPIHLSIGQEAVATGVCFALGPQNRIYGTYRSHGIYIAKGGDLKSMFAELYAKETGCARGKGGSMHLVAPHVGFMGCSAIVGSTIPLATGDALASDYQGRKWATACIFGDGAPDEGVFYESLNFGALKNLPIIYICENNKFAVHSRVEDRHRQTKLYRYGEPLGVSGSRHNGNDVFTVYTVTKEAVEKVLQGDPPLLLEFMTYRWREHVGTGSDHDEAYRDKQELAEALRNDPLSRAEKVLQERFSVTAGQFKTWKEEIMEEIEEAVVFAEKSSFPPIENLFRGVFKEIS
ncbi:thiamine pyrophosphate-dependent dehydrogenase E1 component subunit alpha [Acidobacteria bacterium AH-259-A15]|nr:thiamine pyrophosphate-dependent dehydrogenase E1 component subunit alpha [Acidobacteria bacterium AH-259-A15]